MFNLTFPWYAQIQKSNLFAAQEKGLASSVNEDDVDMQMKFRLLRIEITSYKKKLFNPDINNVKESMIRK